MSKLFLILLHKLHVVKLVWLEDFEGVSYLSIKRKHPFGGNWCYVYPIYKIGHVNLLDNGVTTGQSNDITKWKDY